MSVKKTKLVTFLFIFLLSQATALADFEPALKAALTAVSSQRDRSMSLASDSHGRARQIERDAFPGRLPTEVPEYVFCQAAASGRFDDMKVIYNRILDSIRNGSATENSIRSEARSSIVINNVFVDNARKCLSRGSLTDFNEQTITEGWLKILSSYQSMKDKEKKKLSKHLDKNLRWKTIR